MADFVPPTGPPPPKLPQGWKAVWNDQYKEWFYVNIYNKKSQWDKPDSPVYPPGDGADAPPGGPPPAYQDTGAKVGPEKGGLAAGEAGMTEDERLARQLQEEENRRAGLGGSGAAGSRGEADSYFNEPYAQQQQGPGGLGVPPTNDGRLSPGASPGSAQRRGILGKLFGKDKYGAQQQQYPPQGYPQQGYYPPQGAPGYGGYGQPGYGQPGYGQAPYMQQQPGRRPGKAGMGTAGAAALGVGGGLLGGMLLGEAIEGHDGGDHGGDDGGYGGDDGGDYGGGDGGGDFGGGDFGGGDMGGGF